LTLLDLPESMVLHHASHHHGTAAFDWENGCSQEQEVAVQENCEVDCCLPNRVVAGGLKLEITPKVVVDGSSESMVWHILARICPCIEDSRSALND